jgi:predicted nuclease of predicted toxin-antitoxin system
MSGATDAVVAQAVVAEGRILVTFDLGFGDIRAYPPGSHPGIVVLRLARQALASVNEALLFLLSYDELTAIAGCTMIVDGATIRVRRPPPSTS